MKLENTIAAPLSIVLNVVVGTLYLLGMSSDTLAVLGGLAVLSSAYLFKKEYNETVHTLIDTCGMEVSVLWAFTLIMCCTVYVMMLALPTSVYIVWCVLIPVVSSATLFYQIATGQYSK